MLRARRTNKEQRAEGGGQRGGHPAGGGRGLALGHTLTVLTSNFLQKIQLKLRGVVLKWAIPPTN